MASGVVKCFVACALVACAVDQRRLGAAEPPPLGVIDGAGGAGATSGTDEPSADGDGAESGGAPAEGVGAGDQGGASVDSQRPTTALTSFSFDAGDTGGFQPDDGVEQSSSDDDADSNPDSGSLLVTEDTLGASDEFKTGGTTVCLAAQEGVTYDVAAQIEIDAGQSAGSGGFEVEFLDGTGCDGESLGQAFFLTAATGAWTLGEKTPAAPAGARTALFRLLVSKRASDPPFAVHFDDVRFEAQ